MHYDFAPPTFLLPEQGEAFMAELAAGAKGGRAGRPTYILKLDSGSMVGNVACCICRRWDAAG